MAPRQPYWSAHVDQHNVPFYDVSALLYLCDAGVDFEGGAFAFKDHDGDEVVEPRVGRCVLFASGCEHVHQVAAVTGGVRYAMGLWFTLARECGEAR